MESSRRKKPTLKDVDTASTSTSKAMEPLEGPLDTGCLAMESFQEANKVLRLPFLRLWLPSHGL